MKTYNNIEDLYREKFSAYASEPPAGVWERIQTATDAKQSAVKGKAAFFAVAVAVVAMLGYWGMNRSSSEGNGFEKQQKTPLVVQDIPSETTDNVREEVIVSQENPSVEIPKKVVLDTKKVEVLAQEIALPQNIDSESKTENKTAFAIPATQQTSEKENTEEKPKVKEKTEATTTKSALIVVSKDTTVCENSIVELFVHNAKNVRWSTGETKKSIYVSPSSDEQYSATFSLDNNRDSTVFIHIKCIRCSELFVPNAFTPNGDGLNDVFAAQSEEEYSYFEMTIYSRDGKMVLFSSKDIKRGWDGTYKGVPQPHGSYMYVIRYKDVTGKMHDKKGNFLLISQ
jgi:gliding motility-associated-like protein